MPYKTLTERDLSSIKAFIECYSGASSSNIADLKYILRYWNTSKSKLFHMFGNQLILRKKISYMPDGEEKFVLMDTAKYKDNDFIAFKSKFYDILDTRPEFNDIRYEVMDLFSTSGLMDNVYRGPKCEIKFPNQQKPYKLVEGMKAIKALGAISKAYGFEEEFEKFRIAHSRVYNDKICTGNLCLSIHPIDYMSMSINNCGWESCMSWPDGCHSLGTVEMMNSDCVVVAYLESDKPLTWYSYGKQYECSNKKWRELFIVEENVISEIKAYPYQNKNLATECLNWLRELKEAYEPEIKFCKNIIKNYDSTLYFPSKRLRLCFDAGYMYNDFGAIDDHYCYINREFINDETQDYSPEYYTTDKELVEYFINYSGIPICVCCGDTFDMDFYEEGTAEHVVCPQCSGRSYCEWCHSWVDGDLYQVDGMTICECCYEDHTDADFFTHEDHFNDDMRSVYLVPDGIKILRESYLPYSILVYKPEEVDWSKYLTSEDGFVKIKRERYYFWGDEKYFEDIFAIRASSIPPETKEKYFSHWSSGEWAEIEKMV